MAGSIDSGRSFEGEYFGRAASAASSPAHLHRSPWAAVTPLTPAGTAISDQAVQIGDQIGNFFLKLFILLYH